ncbi:calmodulin-like protein 3 [Mangifera indica]|uniref:calmodulin-like protein 3 n=1 Tax=Mangifera indica TaxID=29780 RepID=UPI001CFC1EB0|nr:calmodulin-like protein 3 [Mangifera indica]
MPSFLLRLFLLHNLLNSFLLYLIPKKLRSFLPTAWYPPPRQPQPQKPPQNFISFEKMDHSEVDRVFEMFDRNGDGRISKEELSDSLQNLGIVIPEAELAQMIERIDVDGDGCVDIEEFGTLYKTLMEERKEEEEEDMREAFNVFDQNGDGFITCDELKAVLASLGLKQGRTAEDCKRMIMKVDVDGDGMVDYKEFKQMMKSGGFSALG